MGAFLLDTVNYVMDVAINQGCFDANCQISFIPRVIGEGTKYWED